MNNQFYNVYYFQMLDMIMPKKRNVISLQDMKRCRMTPIFFDTFFNLEKYLDHEQRDPFASNRDVDEDGNEVKKKPRTSVICNNISSVVEFQEWWVLKSKIFVMW